MKFSINKFTVLIIVVICVTFLACNKSNKKCRGYVKVQKEAIQGAWTHIYPDSSSLKSDYALPIKYKINFVDDSFFLTRNLFGDDFSLNGCSYLNYFDYIKGTFVIKNNKIKLWGIKTGENWDPNNYDYCYYPEGIIKEFYTEWGIYFCNNELNLEIYDAKNITINFEHWYRIKMKRE